MYKKKKDKNGLTMIVSPMPHMTSVSLAIWIGVGGRHESIKNSGISHFIEHMLFKGTHTRSARDLKEAIEGVGGALNAFTSDETTCYMVKVPAKYLELGMEILSDMVLNAKFTTEDMMREKFVVCEEIKMYRDQPAERVVDLLEEIMWPDNALGRPLTGTITTVKGFSESHLTTFKKKNYHPSNITVVAAGKITPKQFFDCTSRQFQDQKRKKKISFKKPKTSQNKTRIKIRHDDINQTHIAMGFYALDKNIRERFAMKLMNVIFGGNMSSRLFEQLREKDGLCYDIASSYKRHSDVGEVDIHAGVDNKKAVKSVIAILSELKKLKTDGVTAGELKRAKKYARGQFLLAMENTSHRMIWLGERSVVHGEIPEIKKVLKHIEEVTVSDVQKAANKIFKASSINLAMVGKLKDKEKNIIRKELGKL